MLSEPARSDACPMRPRVLEIDPAERRHDATAPEMSSLKLRVHRGRLEKRGCSSNLGSITIEPVGVDDRTPPGEIGYVVRLVEGSVPEGLELPSPPYQTPYGSTGLLWDERAGDGRSFSAVLEVVPVDRAGNEGTLWRVSVRGDGIPVWDRFRTWWNLLGGFLVLCSLTIAAVYCCRAVPRRRHDEA